MKKPVLLLLMAVMLGFTIFFMMRECNHRKMDVRNHGKVRHLLRQLEGRYPRSWFAGETDPQKYLNAVLSEMKQRNLTYDAYGREMKIFVDESTRVIKVWSTGKNGVDELGNGDDLMIQDELPDFSRGRNERNIQTTRESLIDDP